MISLQSQMLRILLASYIIKRCASHSLRGKSISNAVHSGLNFSAKIKVHEQSSDTLLYGGWITFSVKLSNEPAPESRLLLNTVCQQDLDFTFVQTEEYDGSGFYTLELKNSDLNVAESRPWRNHYMSMCQLRLIALYGRFVDVDGVDAYRSHVMDSTIFYVEGENAKTIQLQ